MTLRGHIQNGAVVFDEPVQLPDGTPVQVDVKAVTPGEMEQEIPSLYERLKPYIGAIKNLPPDFARNHDHYIHGAPRTDEP